MPKQFTPSRRIALTSIPLGAWIAAGVMLASALLAPSASLAQSLNPVGQGGGQVVATSAQSVYIPALLDSFQRTLFAEGKDVYSDDDIPGQDPVITFSAPCDVIAVKFLEEKSDFSQPRKFLVLDRCGNLFLKRGAQITYLGAGSGTQPNSIRCLEPNLIGIVKDGGTLIVKIGPNGELTPNIGDLPRTGATDVASLGKTAFVAYQDGSASGVKLFDFSDLDNIVPGVDIPTLGPPVAITTHPTEFPDRLFVLSKDFSSGHLQIFDFGGAAIGSMNWGSPVSDGALSFPISPALPNPLPVGAQAFDPKRLYGVADTGLKVIDVSDPSMPSVVGSHDSPLPPSDVSAVGDTVSVANGRAGLRIIDASNPASPQLIGVRGSLPSAQDVAVAGNYAYCSDLYVGLKIFDVSQPTTPTLVGRYDIASGQTAGRLAVSGSTVYLCSSQQLYALDVSAPTTPTLISAYFPDDYPRDVAVQGTNVFVANFFGMKILDYSNPALPTQTATFSTANRAIDVEIDGTRAYVQERNVGLKIVDISNPAIPSLIGTFSAALGAFGSNTRVSGGKAYIASGLGALQIVDVATNPATPTLLGTFSDPLGQAADVDLASSLAFVSYRAHGLRVIDVSDPANPIEKTAALDTSFNAHAESAFLIGLRAFVADGGGGLQILDYDPNPPTPSPTPSPSPSPSATPTVSLTPSPTPSPLPPVILQHPISQTVFLGQMIAFIGAASEDATSHQWTKDDQPLNNATDSYLILNGVVAADAGVYKLTASNAGGTAVSNGATLTIIDPRRPNSAGFLESSMPPAIYAGSDIFIGVTFVNTGPVTWGSGSYALEVTEDGSDLLQGTVIAWLSDLAAVIPGAGAGTATFVLHVFAPITPGDYVFKVRMFEINFGPFGPETPIMAHVIERPNDAGDWLAYE